MGEPACLIDGFGPVPVERPASVEELADVVRRAASAGQALYPLGGRTLLGLGNRPAKAGIGVDLRSLDQVIDYPARDMTITVQSGMTVAPPLLVKVTVTAEVAAGWESVTVTVVLWFIAIILAKARLDCNEAMESLSRYFRCQSK